jgi:hypothetical protein
MNKVPVFSRPEHPAGTAETKANLFATKEGPTAAAGGEKVV